MSADLPVIAVLGASGLIGQAVSLALMQERFPVIAAARHFDPAQRAAYGDAAAECAIMAMDAPALAAFFDAHGVDIVVNCIGVLQASGRGDPDDVHSGFARRLTAALTQRGSPGLLVQISVPGLPEEDHTAFSVTKRQAEQVIATSGVPYVILRPGFVVADAAYGGSALMRALAALPVTLPVAIATRPFTATDVDDIAHTIAFVARRWAAGERNWRTVWDVMERAGGTAGDVLAAFRRRLGEAEARWSAPGCLLTLGARAGDVAARLGWSPPVRSTALAELRRGVAGDPGPWMAATGIEPMALDVALRRRPATVQEKWFSRLYLLKPLVIAVLAIFWIASGAIALLVSFDQAAAHLTGTGVSEMAARGFTAITALADIAIGGAIAVRRFCRPGLMAGIAVSLAYMAGGVALLPGLWLDPLGPLVKVGPVILLMLVALAVLDER